MNAFRRVLAKELRVESRARDLTVALALLALAVVAATLLALRTIADRASVVAATLVLSLVMASAVALSRSFAAEREAGTLDALLALPLERGAIYLGKAAAIFLLVAGVEVASVLVLFAIEPEIVAPGRVLVLLPTLVLAAGGVSLVGTALSALTLEARSRESLLPLLALPLLLPVLMAGTSAARLALTGASLAETKSQLFLLAGYDIVFAALAWSLFDAATED